MSPSDADAGEGGPAEAAPTPDSSYESQRQRQPAVTRKTGAKKKVRRGRPTPEREEREAETPTDIDAPLDSESRQRGLDEAEAPPDVETRVDSEAPPEADAAETSETDAGDADEAGTAGDEAPPESAHHSYRRALAGDRHTTDDRLGFRPYVDAMAAFIASPDTKPPVTISIEGEWGSGKSSFMAQLRERLDETRDADTGTKTTSIWFNPWRHDKDESVWSAFALEVEQQLKEAMSWRRWFALLRLNWARFDGKAGFFDVARVLFKGALYVGAILLVIAVVDRFGVEGVRFVLSSIGAEGVNEELFERVMSGLGFTGVTLGSAIVLLATLKTLFEKLAPIFRLPVANDLLRHIDAPDYASRVSFIERFHEDFGRIVRAYAGDRRVVVFVDDLDRCEIPRAADLLQAINLMIGQSSEERPEAQTRGRPVAPERGGLVFVLGMDREKVAAGVAVKHKDVLDYLPVHVAGEAEPDVERYRPAKGWAGLSFGYEFIQKFVQVPFYLPRPGDAQITGLFAKRVTPASARSATSMDASPKYLWSMWGKEPKRGHPIAPEADLKGRDSGASAPGQGASSERPTENPERSYTHEKLVEVITGDDMDEINQVCIALADGMGRNPRRLKQLRNLVRLNYAIAEASGLLYARIGEDEVSPITLGKIAKFSALVLAAPVEVGRLAIDPSRIERLERFEIDEDAEEERPMDGKLRAILDMRRLPDDAPQSLRDHHLTSADVQRLLRLSTPPPTDSIRGAVNSSADVQGGNALVDLEFVRIPPGTFRMGSRGEEPGHEERESPQHEVSIGSFLLAKYPVTNAQYADFLRASGHREPATWDERGFNQPDQPVVGVEWDDARAFCEWAGLRLPSEAEWEYACRAGTTTAYWFGDDPEALVDYAWFDKNSDGRTHPVGEKRPNPWGLHDMHGNVWEWCEDQWHDDYDGAPVDGAVWSGRGSDARVFRGGCWDRPATNCRSASRNRWPPGNRWNHVGFRPARSLSRSDSD